MPTPVKSLLSLSRLSLSRSLDKASSSRQAGCAIQSKRSRAFVIPWALSAESRLAAHVQIACGLLGNLLSPEGRRMVQEQIAADDVLRATDRGPGNGNSYVATGRLMM
jgi:hypothetical protein